MIHFFIAVYYENSSRDIADLKFGQAKILRDLNFCGHMLRKVAADKSIPPEEIEIDAVSRYIPCYNMQAVRELESNLQKNDQFKKNMVSLVKNFRA